MKLNFSLRTTKINQNGKGNFSHAVCYLEIYSFVGLPKLKMIDLNVEEDEEEI